MGLEIARARGMKVTTPLMKSGSTDDLIRRFDEFYTHCPECNQQGSKYFVDVLAFNAFAVQNPPSPYEVSGQFAYLNGLAQAVKDAYTGRPLYATNFGTLMAHEAVVQAEALTAYGVLDTATSNIDKVFYFAARDYCGGPDCTTHNLLEDVVESGPHVGKSLARWWSSPASRLPEWLHVAARSQRGAARGERECLKGCKIVVHGIRW